MAPSAEPWMCMFQGPSRERDLGRPGRKPDDEDPNHRSTARAALGSGLAHAPARRGWVGGAPTCSRTGKEAPRPFTAVLRRSRTEFLGQGQPYDLGGHRIG